MTQIHPTAIVSAKAEIGKNVIIEPYAVIYDDVKIGDDCYIGPHAAIYDGARIGNRVKILQSASVSNIPQDLKYANEEAYFYIGDDTVIREFVTLHKGTVETGFSKVGKNCLLMAYAHIAHDCVLGDNVIIANSVQIGGHVHLGDYVIIGGTTPIHQFVKIGEHAMIGGGFRVTYDIPPYVLAANEPLRFAGLNLVGLRRRGFTNDEIMELKETYMLIYKSGKSYSQVKDVIIEKYGSNKYVQRVIEFMDNIKRTGLR
ncbi:MAG: acyl-ACP--UDP-N-acetylglucosamine O-acyltransferase [Melioribacteraceae bacterium]|nr:acyl-ACP--UDP-N-acetylglucosamine O-acyltransferase [Melioribacteraceae bacterium]MCF8354938.1 acyl-ACP--UDP-N-acetylglucosamine O-acyltransferase [Melioribacteraceae bacterium]MCF8392373.1 acyl-ACP--UDP-N-acetylglucosamine O-acyltransferase [Melioribacteraceae bacterium]MCF8417893.1 acyl-ACP--UDP-N-acetylglucosamine O-acyltransferase [Melioribacteraceae bacterium]